MCTFAPCCAICADAYSAKICLLLRNSNDDLCLEHKIGYEVPPERGDFNTGNERGEVRCGMKAVRTERLGQERRTGTTDKVMSPER